MALGQEFWEIQGRGRANRQYVKVYQDFNSSDSDVQEAYYHLTGERLDASSGINLPFYTDYGSNISIGRMSSSILVLCFLIWAVLPLKMVC